MFERGTMTFMGGPYDGETVEAWLPASSRQHVYRSGTKGDSTIYAHRGMNFHLYYRWFDVWRWEGLDVFDIIIVGPVVQLVRAPDCRSGSCGFESRQGRLLAEDMTEIRLLMSEEGRNDHQCPTTTDFDLEQAVAACQRTVSSRGFSQGMGWERSRGGPT